tara:strand:+ start:3103 stop:4287 length:1185 start_codon:yes stop_codon:yes gene_type:complete
MRIVDAIYGSFELPGYLDGLLMSPEFRRLTEVRLININSPSLSSLSETRRYSHTLGVLHLALCNPMLNFGPEEHRAVLAAIVVHDVGTPAFAHLFEYFLSDRFDWDHESVIPELLQGSERLDPKATQIFFAQQPKFLKLCEKANIDQGLVISILEGNHPASKLIFGSVDYDNIDNVARMNWMLGNKIDVNMLKNLASGLGATISHDLELEAFHRDNLLYWMKLRKAAYDILVFDGPTVAAQAVLSDAIQTSLESGALNLEDWTYSDHELVEALRMSSPKTKSMLDRDFIGELPKLVMCKHVQFCDHRLFELSRDQIALLIKDYLKHRRVSGRTYGYSFRDKGTFNKRIVAWDPRTESEWELGERSNSLIVYGFSTSAARLDPAILGNDFLDWSA